MGEHLVPVRTRIVGPRDQVIAGLTTAHARGELVALHDAPTYLTDGRVTIHATLLRPAADLEPAPRPSYTTQTRTRPAEQTATAWYRSGPVWVRVAALAAFTGLLSGIGWAVWTAVAWVIAHRMVVIGGIAVVVLVLLGAGATACCSGGTHARGCSG